MKPDPRTARTAAAVAAAAVLALLAAACGAGPSSAGSAAPPNAGGAAGSSAPDSRLVAFSRCVRSRGVPDYPDPSASEGLPKLTAQQLGVSDSVYQAATQACQHLLPGGGSGPTAAEVRQEWSGMLSFARCMRSHGVPDWPDPTPYPQNPARPTFNVPASIQPVPQIISRMRECQRLVPDNYVGGHIDNESWQAVSREMAGL